MNVIILPHYNSDYLWLILINSDYLWLILTILDISIERNSFYCLEGFCRIAWVSSHEYLNLS